MTLGKPNRKKLVSGFTLIETLVGSFVFLLVALSAYGALGVLMDAVSASQAKISATSVANETFEIVRNLPYTDVGIVAGLPVGKIARTQTIVRDGYSFNTKRIIRSVDDPFDGTIGGNPSDSSPADYKLVDLDISCTNCKIFSPLKFTTLVSPRALETTVNNGALFVQIFDAGGIPIENASVHIVNTQTNPDTIIDETTDNAGWVKIVDAPPGTNAYNITATKSGYSQDQTYPLNGAAGANPVKPDATVVLQQITQLGFSIDRLGSLNISTIDNSCTALPNINFSLTGTKIIGTPAVLKYSAHTFTTNASGTYSLSNVEWDTYSALLASTSYDLAGVNPFQIFAVNPNETKTLQIIVVPHVNRAFLVSVKDSADVAVNGATVRLQKSGFDQTKITNTDTCSTPGQVFWNGLESGTYTLTVSKSGYQTSASSISMSANWQNKIVILNP